MAAVLACGEDAVLSHRGAAALWQLLPSSLLEVTAPTARGRPGIKRHRARLADDEITRERGIPVTTVPRTLFDLAAVVPRHRLERAINEAEVQRRLTDSLSLPVLLKRHPRRRGSKALRAILETGATLTRSDLEARFLMFVEQTRLPTPEANAHLLINGIWIECDFVWRAERVVAELDGRDTHDTAAAFERDRARDRALAAAGWRTVRVTWHQLRREPESLAADLRQILANEKMRWL
jgi:very-short-patch-repair endonuclease